MKGSQLSIDYLKVFRDLAEAKSFSEAAETNHLTQSAVSQQLAYLERLFGKKLVERGNNRFALTEEGVALLDGAYTILKAHNEIMDRIHNAPGDISGDLKIETSYSIGLHLLPPYLAGFLKKFPRVKTDVEYKRSDRICTDVLAGVCDVGVVVFPCCDHPLIEVVPFKKEKLVFVCSPQHRLAHEKTIKWSRLQDEKFAAFHREFRTRRVIDKFLQKYGVTVNIVHEFDNIETLKRSVEIGNATSILPETTVQQEVKNKVLKCIPLAGGPFYRETGIILRTKKSHSRATQEFVRFLRK